MKYDEAEFERQWLSTRSDGENKGIVMFLEPTAEFYRKKAEANEERRSA